MDVAAWTFLVFIACVVVGMCTAMTQDFIRNEGQTFLVILLSAGMAFGVFVFGFVWLG